MNIELEHLVRLVSGRYREIPVGGLPKVAKDLPNRSFVGLPINRDRAKKLSKNTAAELISFCPSTGARPGF